MVHLNNIPLVWMQPSIYSSRAQNIESLDPELD